MISTDSTLKVVPYSITSVGLRADSGFLAVSLQITLVINPVVGCRYYSPAKEIIRLSRYESILVGDRGTQI